MQYIAFSEHQKFSIAILAYDLDYVTMKKVYVEEGLIVSGAKSNIDEEVIAYKLPYITTEGRKKKRKALGVSEQREFLKELLETLTELGVRYIMCANPEWFKTLTGQTKAALEVGSLYHPCGTYFSFFTDIKIAYVPNFKMMMYDPAKTKAGIQIASNSIVADITGHYKKPGEDIMKRVWFPISYSEIKLALDKLYAIPELTIDIEGFSLQHHDAGIASIAFGLDTNTGVAFQVDYAPGYPNIDVRHLLVSFFYNRYCSLKRKEHKNIWHGGTYDLTVLVYQLYNTYKNKSYPIDNFFDMFDIIIDKHYIEDTKIISYLATNSCAGNTLSLKAQAVEFAGNYAVDEIQDITKLSIRELLEYNMIDALSTWFTYNKNQPIMVEEEQEEIYRTIFLPSIIDIIDMQLTGLPVDKEQVAKSKLELEKINTKALDFIRKHPIAIEYLHHLKIQEMEKLHAKWKKKRTSAAEINLEFNPNSDSQLAGLLYSPDFFNLPVLGYTDSGAPSTKGKYIEALKQHTEDTSIIDFLDSIIELKDSAILLSTFIPALENARLALDGNYYMHGSFNLGGTVSGRLSSSDPNLQNLPSKSRLAKYIKLCIRAPKGWLFVGLDFDSLEDKISGLLTKDPNKLKVYTDGFDGHCLRAYSYFGDQMPDIDPNNVQSINSIENKYPYERQISKTPTFLLTYGGTYHGLMSNCGFDLDVAQKIERNYRELYQVSDRWVAERIDAARSLGYVTAAFGLRVRTPILKQTVDTERHTPHAARAEARTAGNALGQSWGLLNNRAASAFMKEVRESEEMRDKIRICCQIHDAQYYLIKADPMVLHWFNERLVSHVKWQNHPSIEHDKVKLSGSTSIFYPSWAKEHILPNHATLSYIKEFGRKVLQEGNKSNA